MFSKKFFISQIIFLVLFAAMFWVVRHPAQQPLAVHASVAPFELTDALNRKVTLADLRGKIWVADFMFTTCSGICPMMTKNMGRIYNEFKGDDTFRFVSVSVNPENDSPEVLNKYSQKSGADPKKWMFLTGSREDIQKLVVGSFKMGSIKEPIFHSPYFVLVDKSGRIRGYYNGTDDNAVERLQKDIARLKKER